MTHATDHCDRLLPVLVHARARLGLFHDLLLDLFDQNLSDLVPHGNSIPITQYCDHY